MSSSYDFKLIRHKTNINMKPFLLLKDYLRDDFSSCSSNGFKSFPRSSSTSSVRFLLDLDLHTTSSSSNHHHLTKKNTKKRSISILLQRASGVLLSAVKLLPFINTSSSLSTTTTTTSCNNKSSSSAASSKKDRRGRVFSRKFLKTRFWKNQRWKSFNELQIPAGDHTTTSSTTRGADHNNRRDRWSGREINLQQGHNYSDESPSCTSVECGDQEANAKCPTSEDEDKEQFSPMSVLDCPFHQDAQETTSNFSQRLTAQLEGKANNLKRRFENISDQLMEPFDLGKKMALLSESPSSTVDTTTTMFIDMEKQVKAEDLLSGIMIRSNISSRNLLKLESNKKLLIDFFKEISNNNIIINDGDDEAMKVAEDWANGNPTEVILDWQVREGRQAYIRDMEENGEWKMSKDNDHEMMMMTQQRVVGSEVESGVWSSLLDDLVSELCAACVVDY